MQQLCSQTGCLTVTARGYWFSAGGEKGSFGYYPHLKDAQGYPIYPDTQVRGDLHMAAKWLQALEPQYRKDSCIHQVFGQEGNAQSAMLACTDLKLCTESRKKWRPDRFQVKPTIQIAGSTRTVTHNMLVAKEAAFMDNLTLEARLYVGYTADIKKLDRIRKLLDDAVKLLSGFGAQRSRGYGRGAVKITWDDPKIVSADHSINAESPDIPERGYWNCFLQALTNFRNKPVGPGAAQTLPTRTCIDSAQLRGWLVQTYQRLHGEWPTPSEMQQIRLFPFYPSFLQNGANVPCLPPALSTMKLKDKDTGKITCQDFFGISEEKQESPENFFRPKLSHVGSTAAVSAAKPFQIFFQPTEYRMRNRMDHKFTTVDDGLFMQELVPSGAWFSGRLSIQKPLSNFGRRIWHILNTARPVLRGTWFNCILKPDIDDSNCLDNDFGLVIRPLAFDPAAYPTQSRLLITSQTRFHAPLGRPRRNRICICPGSIVSVCDPSNGIVAWHAFGQKLTEPVKKPSFVKISPEISSLPDLPSDIMSLIKQDDVLSLAQSGFFRQLQHPHLDNKHIEHILDQRMEKFAGKENYRQLAVIYEALRNQPEYNDKQNFIKALLQAVAKTKWQQKRRSKI
jgi:CRISPR/Cas system CSM-associated protein Csm3 (group 7 of RAMP superfamily)